MHNVVDLRGEMEHDIATTRRQCVLLIRCVTYGCQPFHVHDLHPRSHCGSPPLARHLACFDVAPCKCKLHGRSSHRYFYITRLILHPLPYLVGARATGGCRGSKGLPCIHLPSFACMAAASVKAIFKSRLEILRCNARLGVPDDVFADLSKKAADMMVNTISQTQMSELVVAELVELITDGPLLMPDKRAVVVALTAASHRDVVPGCKSDSVVIVNAEHIVSYFTEQEVAKLLQHQRAPTLFELFMCAFLVNCIWVWLVAPPPARLPAHRRSRCSAGRAGGGEPYTERL
jgi:hypothetical protein